MFFSGLTVTTVTKRKHLEGTGRRRMCTSTSCEGRVWLELVELGLTGGDWGGATELLMQKHASPHPSTWRAKSGEDRIRGQCAGWLSMPDWRTREGKF